MQEKTSISIDSGVLKRLRKLAREEETSVSALIERFCSRALGDAELAAAARRDPLTERLLEEMLRPENIERAARIVGETVEDSNLFRARAEDIAKNAQRVKRGR